MMAAMTDTARSSGRAGCPSSDVMSSSLRVVTVTLGTTAVQRAVSQHAQCLRHTLELLGP